MAAHARTVGEGQSNGGVVGGRGESCARHDVIIIRIIMAASSSNNRATLQKLPPSLMEAAERWDGEAHTGCAPNACPRVLQRPLPVEELAAPAPGFLPSHSACVGGDGAWEWTTGKVNVSHLASMALQTYTTRQTCEAKYSTTGGSG